MQQLKELRIDCDADAVLMKVEQLGGISPATPVAAAAFTANWIRAPGRRPMRSSGRRPTYTENIMNDVLNNCKPPGKRG